MVADERVKRDAARLQDMLDAGMLAGAGPIDLDGCSFARAELAARVVLADVDHLLFVRERGERDHARWRNIGRDLELLVRFAAEWRLASRQNGRA